MAEVTPLFPGQTGLTPGRRAELGQGPAQQLDVETPDVPAEPAVIERAPSGLLAQLANREQSSVDDLGPDSDPDPVPDPEDAATRNLPEAVQALQRTLTAFDLNDLASTNAEVRAEAERRLRGVSEQAYLVENVFGGAEQMVRSTFPPRLADRVMAMFPSAAPSLEVPGAQSAAFDPEGGVESGKEQLPAAQQSSHGGGGGGGIGKAAAALAFFPFNMFAAGGSFAMNALRKSAALANSGVAAGKNMVQKGRQTSFDIIGKQVNSLHADIEREAQWLRSHGLDSVVDEMKASGHSLRDAVAGMERGGPLEKVGHQFKGLMTDPQFSERYEGLQEKLNRFDSKLGQYVKGGAALGHDLEGDAEQLCDKLHQATEGFPVKKKDGSFGLISDRIREISEKIREVINNLFKRLTPGGE